MAVTAVHGDRRDVVGLPSATVSALSSREIQMAEKLHAYMRIYADAQPTGRPTQLIRLWRICAGAMRWPKPSTSPGQ